MNSICIFGDSTVWGAYDKEKGGWANRLLLEVLGRKGDEYVEIYNQGITGGTSDTILRRFENESKIRDADALIFQTGKNDSAFRHNGKFLVDLDKFKINIEEIIKRAKKISDNIIFVSIANCDDLKTMPVYWDDLYYSNENLQKYNKALKEVCNKNNILFLDIGFLDSEDFDDDGLHPNIIGHKKILKKVKSFLIENKWI